MIKKKEHLFVNCEGMGTSLSNLGNEKKNRLDFNSIASEKRKSYAIETLKNVEKAKTEKEKNL